MALSQRLSSAAAIETQGEMVGEDLVAEQGPQPALLGLPLLPFFAPVTLCTWSCPIPSPCGPA